jgi:hypothetical protein
MACQWCKFKSREDDGDQSEKYDYDCDSGWRIANLDELLKHPSVMTKKNKNDRVSKLVVWINRENAFKDDHGATDYVVWGEVNMEVCKAFDDIETDFSKTERSCTVEIPAWEGSISIDINVPDEEVVARIADQLESGDISHKDAISKLDRLVGDVREPRRDLAQAIRNAKPDRAIKILKAKL